MIRKKTDLELMRMPPTEFADSLKEEVGYEGMRDE